MLGGDANWPLLLLDIIDSSDVEELPGNPLIFNASFVKERAVHRLELCSTINLSAFYIPALLENLRIVEDGASINQFGLRNSSYDGACFVYDEKLIGCEFVKRGRARTREGLWLGFGKSD